ncbi:hypothetical protein R5R35_012486 [Gryllus longicercus]|uniref:Uncharacterized protein n=1 Tax=Gryllus longicercus TaxID=2509291 RepID=A0AAN9VWY3_9ORTH
MLDLRLLRPAGPGAGAGAWPGEEAEGARWLVAWRRVAAPLGLAPGASRCGRGAALGLALLQAAVALAAAAHALSGAAPAPPTTPTPTPMPSERTRLHATNAQDKSQKIEGLRTHDIFLDYDGSLLYRKDQESLNSQPFPAFGLEKGKNETFVQQKSLHKTTYNTRYGIMETHANISEHRNSVSSNDFLAVVSEIRVLREAENSSQLSSSAQRSNALEADKSHTQLLTDQQDIMSSRNLDSTLSFQVRENSSFTFPTKNEKEAISKSIANEGTEKDKRGTEIKSIYYIKRNVSIVSSENNADTLGEDKLKKGEEIKQMVPAEDDYALSNPNEDSLSSDVEYEPVWSALLVASAPGELAGLESEAAVRALEAMSSSESEALAQEGSGGRTAAAVAAAEAAVVHGAAAGAGLLLLRLDWAALLRAWASAHAQLGAVAPPGPAPGPAPARPRSQHHALLIALAVLALAGAEVGLWAAVGVGAGGAAGVARAALPGAPRWLALAVAAALRPAAALALAALDALLVAGARAGAAALARVNAALAAAAAAPCASPARWTRLRRARAATAHAVQHTFAEPQGGALLALAVAAGLARAAAALFVAVRGGGSGGGGGGGSAAAAGAALACGRAFALLAVLAEVPERAAASLGALFACPSAAYGPEVEQLVQALLAEELAPSGLRFFAATRGFLFGVMGAAATLLVLLLQS